jgi:type IV pilus assembly protein PilA
MEKVRGFTLIELMIVVAIIGLLSAAAVPSFIKYIRRTYTVEAMMSIRRIYDGAVAYYVGEHADKAGGIQHQRFPGTTAATPSTGVPCGAKPVAASPTEWKTPEWAALDFSMNDPMRYQYKFIDNGLQDAAAFAIMQAQGDLDCNKVYSTFQRTCTGIKDGVMGGSGLMSINELE